ncbi:SRPBCC family protein [Microbacterium timonense]|uniref:SRPBCC family protein n=1 Tax=Microbacterium timonense TaxID=2086576 RepID=UPI000D0FD158|nr:SRPBCC domain-containing protein [Microbacterium timonense]
MHELTEEALIAASVDTVWRDFTESHRLAEWFWPPRFEPTAVVEPREWGRWEVRSAPMDMAVEARVLTLAAPRDLRLEWSWAGEESTTGVEITLEAAADAATRVIVRHTGFAGAEERNDHVEGWSSCLQRLVDRHGGPPGEHL